MGASLLAPAKSIYYILKERGVVQSEVGACGRDPIDDVWLSDPVWVKDWTLDLL